MGVVRVKDGVQFTKIAPGGFFLLGVIDHIARLMDCDLTITSACDGEHSGPDDPHHRGEAYDIRSHDLTLTQKEEFTRLANYNLSDFRFFWFLESEGTPNEHFHLQVKKGTVYP